VVDYVVDTASKSSTTVQSISNDQVSGQLQNLEQY
jgi:hypothetical protein